MDLVYLFTSGTNASFEAAASLVFRMNVFPLASRNGTENDSLQRVSGGAFGGTSQRMAYPCALPP